MQNEDNNDFLVVVSNDRYDMYGKPTLRNNFIAKLIKLQGGISDTVPPGIYVATIKRHGVRVEFILEPQK